jgi:uncharacterized membrane protein (DUF485 family)
MKQQLTSHHEEHEQRKSNIGARMTFLYAIIYGGFVILSVFFPRLMGIKFIFGLNLAIAYGLFLIIIAIIFAIIYNVLVRMPNLSTSFQDNQNSTKDMSED